MKPGAWYFVFNKYRAGRVFTFDGNDKCTDESLDDNPLGLGGREDNPLGLGGSLDGNEMAEAEERAEEQGGEDVAYGSMMH